MSVNGIEIKVGQKWRRKRGDPIATVEAVDSAYEHKGVSYPVRAVLERGTLLHYTASGVEYVGNPQVSNDLVELIEDAPTATLPAPASAPALLEAAAGHMRDRAATYDKPEGERSMAQTVAIFNLHHGAALTEAQGWHFMQILKDVRLFTNAAQPHRDSCEDGIAYSALKAEALLKGGTQ